MVDIEGTKCGKDPIKRNKKSGTHSFVSKDQSCNGKGQTLQLSNLHEDLKNITSKRSEIKKQVKS